MNTIRQEEIQNLRWVVFWLFIFLMGLFGMIFSTFEDCEAQTRGVKIGFNENEEPDLAGYRFYWGKESGTYEEPYDIPKERYAEEISINTGWLLPGIWYAALTAYDEAGNESEFSDEVEFQVTDKPPRKPIIIILRIELVDGTIQNFSVENP